MKPGNMFECKYSQKEVRFTFHPIAVFVVHPQRKEIDKCKKDALSFLAVNCCLQSYMLSKFYSSLFGIWMTCMHCVLLANATFVLAGRLMHMDFLGEAILK